MYLELQLEIILLENQPENYVQSTPARLKYIMNQIFTGAEV